MNKTTITIPNGIFYLGDYPQLLNFLPMSGNYIINKVITGCGATTMYLEDPVPTVLCSPRKEMIRCKANSDRFAGRVHLLGSGLRPEATVLEKITRMKDYILSLVPSPFSPLAPVQVPKILVTYDSMKHVMQGLQELGCLGAFRFVIDEFQTIWTDAAFRGDVEAEFMENVQYLSNVVYLSATPYLENYLDQLPEFKNLPYIEIEWPESSTHITNIAYSRYLQGSPAKTIDHIIANYRQNGYFEELMDGNNNIHRSTEAVIFVNDVQFIIKTIKRNGLQPCEVNIICADSEKNVTRLKAENLSVGHAPKEGEPHATFTFATKASYEGTDFCSPCAYTYIFSNVSNENRSNMAIDISLDLPQIMGRQRLDSNFFKYNATFYYKTRPEFTELDKAEFFNKIKTKSDDSMAAIYNFDNCQNKRQRRIDARKYKNAQKVEKYENDYISVVDDKITGEAKLVFNKYVMMNEARAWEVQSSQYTNGNRVMGSAQTAFYSTVISNMVNDFVLAFTGSFETKMKSYATFVDQHPECKELLQMQVQIPMCIKQYYNALGTERLRALSWKEASIKAAFSGSVPIDISGIVRQSFVVGQWYSLKDVKGMLQSIYDTYMPDKKAKATDLLEYMNCTPKKRTDANNNQKNGVLILN